MIRTWSENKTIFLSPWRWTLFALGVSMIGLGVALMVQAHVGLGPWDVLHQGVSHLLNLPIGLASIVVSVIIMLFWIPLGERPGPGSLVNMLSIGLLIDGFMLIVPSLDAGPTPAPLFVVGQYTQMVFGVLVMGFGVGLYLHSGLGAGPRDGVMMGLVRKTGWSVRAIRTVLEVVVLGIGWLLGGTIGLGTIIFALGIGPVVQASLTVLRHADATAHGNSTNTK
jgi:uncharacterized membrane protein YczE